MEKMQTCNSLKNKMYKKVAEQNKNFINKGKDDPKVPSIIKQNEYKFK